MRFVVTLLAVSILACTPSLSEPTPESTFRIDNFEIPEIRRPERVSIQLDEDHHIELHRDGTVTWSEGMDATEAAQAFLNAVKALAPGFFCKETPSVK